MNPDISPTDQQTIKLGEFIIFLTNHTLNWQMEGLEIFDFSELSVTLRRSFYRPLNYSSVSVFHKISCKINEKRKIKLDNR